MTVATTSTPNEQLAGIRDKFITELTGVESRHWRRAKFDASLHQTLVIVAACAGFGALALGFWKEIDPRIVGVIGAIPSLASVLALRLHCVKAANWHGRKAQAAESLRYKLEFEGHDVSSLSTELRTINEQLLREWEKVTTENPIEAPPAGRSDKPQL